MSQELSRFVVNSLLVLFFIAAAPSLRGGASAQPEDSRASEEISESDALRLFSGSCAELAYLSEKQKHTLADPKNDENMPQFCFPEEPFECSDYNQLVASLGELKTSEGGFHCTLVGSAVK